MPAEDPTAQSFAGRLRRRRAELEEEVLNRVRALEDSCGLSRGAYISELRSAVGAGLEFGLDAIDRGAIGDPPQVPDRLLLQARIAARRGIGLDVVMRFYCAGNTQMTDAMIEEAEGCELPRNELKSCFRSLATSFERLLSAVSEEYGRVAGEVVESAEDRRCELIDRLLAGELVEDFELSYDFTAWHRGLVARGPDAQEAVRLLAIQADVSLLSIRRRDGPVWSWLGAPRRSVLREWPSSLPDACRRVSIALGEPAQGFSGWRLTHRQAVAALPLAIKGPEPIVSYAQAPLLATALKDDLLAVSLRQLYIAPLSDERDGGEAAKSTLRAYYEASGNASSAAAALGVNRRTIAVRLAGIEERLGRRLEAFSAEIEIALRLDAIEQHSGSTSDEIPRP